ncbi:hypothetical protein ASPACDRAFT_108842 [Aspergillus aculeatus ATCC 16872]|uniref:Uncharacterized protein n=1 Tax=Aspergillus aculeatus (strain ATCC 16872 / CBS 172.66 / WB 5094) TaxID=690307 RepID=A0A1L9X7F6_ASPA1|nr:uncharacterized protein ASPACDRAFT_108842 [Aspergillus aculeatus ATCC 16872]OJK04370.1 hypothetical protein ASPACDRAFT_108842 [Aspergillus aculeatus ATCC 16872]
MCLFPFLFGRGPGYTPSPTSSYFSTTGSDGYISDADTMSSSYSSSEEEGAQTLIHTQPVRRGQRMRLWPPITDMEDEAEDQTGSGSAGPEASEAQTSSDSEDGDATMSMAETMSLDESVSMHESSDRVRSGMHSNSSSDTEACKRGHNSHILPNTPFRHTTTYIRLGRPEVVPGATTSATPYPAPASARARASGPSSSTTTPRPRRKKTVVAASKTPRNTIVRRRPYDSSSDSDLDHPVIRSFFSAYASVPRRGDSNRLPQRPMARRAAYLDIAAVHPHLFAVEPLRDDPDRAYDADQSDNSSDREEFSDWSDLEDTGNTDTTGDTSGSGGGGGGGGGPTKQEKK